MCSELFDVQIVQEQLWTESKDNSEDVQMYALAFEQGAKLKASIRNNLVRINENPIMAVETNRASFRCGASGYILKDLNECRAKTAR